MHPTTQPSRQDQCAVGSAGTLPTWLTLAIAVAACFVLIAGGADEPVATTDAQGLALATQLGIAAPAVPTL
jgi:hypothetical protein